MGTPMSAETRIWLTDHLPPAILAIIETPAAGGNHQ